MREGHAPRGQRRKQRFVEMQDAVGAATAPARFAQTVW
jgi:hypothetical protein